MSLQWRLSRSWRVISRNRHNTGEVSDSSLATGDFINLHQFDEDCEHWLTDTSYNVILSTTDAACPVTADRRHIPDDVVHVARRLRSLGVPYRDIATELSLTYVEAKRITKMQTPEKTFYQRCLSDSRHGDSIQKIAERYDVSLSLVQRTLGV